ncbi:LADA_0E01970g1_1 [Lachancea dasiensis]|uniref:LADA_0E01970g1_1 n=1 Tax=Lachancea dasiensis TaxID=1072105 RepID=A0A1G4JAW7_9SACH|nr:LADA_0E01970g1_1 [Lachancea dasiensis]
MDSGSAAFGRREPNKAQLRNQLLGSDIGNINVANEQPMPVMAEASHSYSLPGNRPPPANFSYYSQQPGYGKPPLNSGRASFAGYPNGDPRASSMTSQSSNRSVQPHSISNLFRMRNGRSKNSVADEEEETLMEDSDSSILTFNDISSLRNSGGRRYGVGPGVDDTSPIIPTLMTKGHSNMNNVEYRKHLAAQKKMTMNALTKQNQKTGARSANSDPRAMSLQYSHSPFVPHSQPGAPVNQMPPYTRANSMMAGPPPQVRNWNPQIGGGDPQYPRRPAANANGPRTMSLASGTGRRPMVAPPPGNYRPNPVNLPQRAPGAPSPLGPPNAYSSAGPQGSLYPPSQSPQTYQDRSFEQNPTAFNQQSASSSTSQTHAQDFRLPIPSQVSKENVTPLSSSSAVSTTSLSSYRESSQTPESQHGEEGAQVNAEPQYHDNQAQKGEVNNAGKINILKLSDPRQRELKDEEDSSRKLKVKEDNLRKLEYELQQREKKLEDRELKEEKMEDDMAGRIKILSQERSPRFHASHIKSQEENIAAADRRRSQIQSMATFESALSSDSPIKRNPNQATLYKLDNTTDTNAYFTASDLIERDNDRNRDNVSEVTLTKAAEANKISTKPQRSASNSEIQPVLERKDSGLGKARSFFRRLSSKGSDMEGVRRPSSAISLKGRLSTDVLPVEPSSTSEQKQIWNGKADNSKRKSFHSLFSNSSGGTNMGERVKSYASLANIEEKNATDFNFDGEGNLDEEANDKTLDMEDFNQGLKGVDEKSLPQPKVAHVVESPAIINKPPSDTDDDFNFDNTVSQPYKPTFASEDELQPIADESVRGKFKTVCVSSSQMSVLAEQETLTNAIELLSKELTESVSREARLEQKILEKGNVAEHTQLLSVMDFEVELRKKSSKIVELIQQLNDERLKRYIAEEQVMLQENGVKPLSVELVHKIHVLNQRLLSKDEEIALLTEKVGKL